MNRRITASIALLAIAVTSVLAAGVAAQDDIPLSGMGEGNGTADVPVDSWSGLQDAIDAYEQGQVIIVTRDLVCDNDRCISVRNGTAVIDLDGHDLSRVIPDSQPVGPVVSVYRGGDLTVRDSKGTGAITGGWSDSDGGGICVSAGGFCSLEGVTVSGNIQDRNGGGIFAEGCLTMKDSVIEGNIAKGMGGAVYVQTSCYDLVMGGRITATDNEASVGNGIYMLSGTLIRFDGAPADGSAVRVLTETYPYVFTAGLSGTDPEDVFVTDYGYSVGTRGGEAVLAGGHGWQIEEGRFIDWRDYINPDYYSLTGANWMSGVSGERFLNEINIPETHNSCTQDVSGFGATVEWPPEYYETQKRFARQLMEEGVRGFDIRLINWYYDEDGDHFDDGHTLWIGHGKDYDSYHMALDERGNMISFDMLMNWVMQFLTDNPSEVITLDLAPEVEKDHKEEYRLILERTREYLLRYDPHVNPSTGEKFLYSEDGTYGEPYTSVPKLRDCRGKILIACGSDNVDVIGGMVYSNILDVHSVKGTQSVGPEKRVENIMEAYDEYCQGLLPQDAYTHLEDLNMISINCTSKSIGTPMEVEAIVFAEIFKTEHLLDQRGVYYGFWRGDAITAWEANYLWRTNYSDHLQYCTVTVQSGIEGIADQTFVLLKGSGIKIPGCIYPEGPQDHFSGWRADGRIYSEGDEFTVGSDVTFGAVWEYSVSFDANGHGTAPTDQTVEHGGKVTKPADPTEVGWTFGGWFKEAQCENAWDFGTDTVAGDTTLYAKWTVAVYDVKFDVQGHGTAPTDQTVEHGGKITRPADPAADGWIFGGWFKDAGCRTAWDFGTDTVAGDTTLYAKWTVAVYTVTFDVQGHGTAPTDQTVEYGGKVTRPADPSEEHYTFGGWYKEAGCRTAWDFGTDTVAGDTTLYAKWTAPKYQVKIEQGQNGTVVNKGTFDIPYGENILITGNTMTIGVHTFTATPDGPSETATYSFFGWVYEGGVPPGKVTGKMTITGIFQASVTPKIDDRGNATVDAKGEGDSPIESEIPAGTKTLAVDGQNYSVSVGDASGLAGKTVTVTVAERVNPSSEVTGKAYEFTFRQDGASYTGKMSVTLPFEPVEGKKAAVYFIDGGKVTKMNVTGSGKDGVTFETEHNSVYVVSYEDQEPGSDGQKWILLILAIAVVAAALAGVTSSLRNRP